MSAICLRTGTFVCLSTLKNLALIGTFYMSKLDVWSVSGLLHCIKIKVCCYYFRSFLVWLIM